MSENFLYKHTTVERPYLCNVIHYTGKTIVFIETAPSIGNVSDEINVIRDLYFFQFFHQYSGMVKHFLCVHVCVLFNQQGPISLRLKDAIALTHRNSSNF